jgi:poly(A) polymerase
MRAALDACTARANDLMALSRERIADELLKLLAMPDPAPTVGIMLERGDPEAGAAGDRARAARDLEALIAAERSGRDRARRRLRRLAALLPRDPAVAEDIAARLKLSNKARKRLACAARPSSVPRRRRSPIASAVECAVDRLLLAAAARTRARSPWKAPRLPISGGALIASAACPKARSSPGRCARSRPLGRSRLSRWRRIRGSRRAASVTAILGRERARPLAAGNIGFRH